MNNEKMMVLGLETVWATALIGAALLLIVLLIVFLKNRKRSRLSDARKLENLLQGLRKDELRSIIIPDGIGGLLEIERLILMEQGLLIIKTYAMSGHLFGADRIDNWTQVIDGRSFKFTNPLEAIDNAKYAVQLLAPKTPVYSRVIFTDNSNFPKGKPEDVSLLSSLEQDLMPLKEAAIVIEKANIAWDRIVRVAQLSSQVAKRRT